MSHYFAQPHGRSPSKRARDNQPLDFNFLASGSFGDVFLSHNLTTVVKLFSKRRINGTSEDNVATEFQILEELGRIAPDYVPVPCTLTRINETLGIQMPNVGHTISMLLPKQCHTSDRLTPLEPDEIALCIMQSVHFVLLIKDQVKMEDLHNENVCVQNTKENIRLRFIDVGMWHQYDPAYEKRTCWIDVVVKNAQILFLDEDFEDNGLWREVLSDCFTACRDNRYEEMLKILESSFVIKSGLNIFSILTTMAGRILEFLRDTDSVCYLSGKALFQRINEAAYDARISLRPSLRRSFYSKKTVSSLL